MLYGLTCGEVLVEQQVDGPALTAAAAASHIAPAAKKGLPRNFFDRIGKQLLAVACGKISCAVTTPGTARYDVRFGGTTVWDSLAINLNIVAKTNVGWFLYVLLTCRAIGTAGNLSGQGWWVSEAGIASPLPTVGGSAVFTLPYNTNISSGVGANFDTTAEQVVDQFFTQTVATGSHTTLQYQLISPN